MKLNEIQQALKVPKSRKNSFGNYNYRNAEDILDAVKPLLGDSVLTLTDEIIPFGVPVTEKLTNDKGKITLIDTVGRFYVKTTATFYEGGLPKMGVIGAGISVSAFARESLDKSGMDAAQITGAASSYARKYALNGLFLIDDTKDADSDENAPVASQTRQELRRAPQIIELTHPETAAALYAAIQRKDPKIELDAQKTCLVTLLKKLGNKIDGKTAEARKKQVADAVFDHINAVYSEQHLDVINDALAAKLNAQNK